MTSKTFKSALGSPMTLVVEDASEVPGVYLTISRSTILLAPSDAPALALAILEAAGGRDALGVDVSNAMIDLREYVTEQERITAEAEAQAELEAEALALFNAFWRSDGDRPLTLEEWSVPTEERQDWLAVARKAREMRAEK